MGHSRLIREAGARADPGTPSTGPSSERRSTGNHSRAARCRDDQRSSSASQRHERGSQADAGTADASTAGSTANVDTADASTADSTANASTADAGTAGARPRPHG